MQVVIKQGQILPIQRCIKALLADAAVLGNPLAASDDNLQQLSARIASVLLYNRDLHIDGTALSTGNSNSIVAHIPRQASAAENNENATILQGTISGPEVFNAMVDHDNQVDGGDAHADSHRAGNPAYSAEEDVGCNGLVHFFLAEMLGGSAA